MSSRVHRKPLEWYRNEHVEYSRQHKSRWHGSADPQLLGLHESAVRMHVSVRCYTGWASMPFPLGAKNLCCTDNQAWSGKAFSLLSESARND
jgi:hypothetical protein